MIGNDEKHELNIDYSTMTGTFKILLDGKVYSSSRVMFVGHTPFALQVGDKEKHNIRIELDNPLFFAFRGSSIKIFVDENLVQQDHVGGSILMLLFVILIPIIIFFSFFFGFFLRLNH